MKNLLSETRTSPVHFNLPDHKGLDDLRIQGVEALTSSIDILERESVWMWNIKSHNINGGLDISDDFFTNLTLRN